MKKLRISFLAIILLLCFCANLNAQNAIPAVGGDIHNENGSASYTVGQLVYTQKSDSHNSALEGVQQPYEISIISGVDGEVIQPIEALVYPIPANDDIKLKINTLQSNALRFKLYDTKGQLHYEHEITSEITSILTSELIAGVYFIKIFDNNSEIKTIKILIK